MSRRRHRSVGHIVAAAAVSFPAVVLAPSGWAGAGVPRLSSPAGSFSSPARPRMLAISTGKALYVLKGKSATKVGPVSVPGVAAPELVVDFQWSAGGRYLAWEQWAQTNGAGAVVWYDTASGRRVHWELKNYPEGAGFSVTSAGVQSLTPGPDINDPSRLVSYSARGKPATTKLVKVPLADSVVGYSGGFVSGPDIRSGTQLWRVSATGAVAKVANLPKPTKSGPPYEVTGVSADGLSFAAELGDHTGGCGVGPASKIYVVNLHTGAVKRVALPSGPHWRVWSLEFEPSDTLDATLVNCTQQAKMSTTVFHVQARGSVSGSKSGALVDTSADGVVAYQPGSIKLGNTRGAPVLRVVASGPLTVAGKAVPGIGGAVVSAVWAP